MNSKVIVSADDNGNVIRQTKNEEWSNVLLTQSKLTFSNNNVMGNKPKSVLMLIRTDEALAMQEAGVLFAGQELDGNIIVEEQTMPFNETDPDRDLKVAGDTGIICATADGEPIYRKSRYDASGTLTDTLVPHANGAEIRAAMGLETKTETKAASNQRDLEDSIAEEEAKAKAKAEEVTEEVTEEVDEFEL